MAEYTAEAFKWSGTGYNAQYNTSHTAVFKDNDAAYDGSGDNGERISIDGGSFGKTSGSPYAIDISFTGTSGASHTETFYFFNTGGEWYFLPGPGSAFTTGATLGSYQSHSTGWNYADVVCFARGTLISTAEGPCPVENLRPGQAVVTADGGRAVLRMVTSRAASAERIRRNPKLRPVLIRAGALGAGLPLRDLRVSRQHRLMVCSRIAERMFGQAQVLAAAHQLTALPGIRLDDAAAAVEYFHLIFDRHEVVLAEGAPAESLLMGPEALKTLPPAEHARLKRLFPTLDGAAPPPEPARHVPAGKQQRSLIARHKKNSQPLLQTYAPQQCGTWDKAPPVPEPCRAPRRRDPLILSGPLTAPGTAVKPSPAAAAPSART
ncbi:Hint domain-containing protein [Leisingera sp. ANG59]|uniref:Hint domain-containing protein n=1 Tax=Leisingera sp. ANG59 TaxID=2675221 RepID=UPI001574736D|nr:Hint domain-containing protein [Leisingera sp. ANG59]NSY38547.1 hemolysin [Leisingera sp. ANG59]